MDLRARGQHAVEVEHATPDGRRQTQQPIRGARFRERVAESDVPVVCNLFDQLLDLVPLEIEMARVLTELGWSEGNARAAGDDRLYRVLGRLEAYTPVDDDLIESHRACHCVLLGEGSPGPQAHGIGSRPDHDCGFAACRWLDSADGDRALPSYLWPGDRSKGERPCQSGLPSTASAAPVAPRSAPPTNVTPTSNGWRSTTSPTHT